MPRLIMFFTLTLCLSACSNKQIYDGAQYNNERECYQRPESQIDECLQQNSQPYEDYQREREALKKAE